MAKFDTSIVCGDDEFDVLYSIRGICGISLEEFYSESLSHFSEQVNSHFHEVEEYIRVHACHRIGFQVFGYFILKTGSMITERLRQDILLNSRWEDEIDYWDDVNKDSRKRHLMRFREAIINYIPGDSVDLDRQKIVKKLVF